MHKRNFVLRSLALICLSSCIGIAAPPAAAQQTVAFVPDDPPKAALISISSPTADGEVTLSGAVGAVTPQSAVVATTLETGHFTTAQAADDGSFTATLFAPPGTSILIKADPVGTSVAEFVPVAGDGGSEILLSNGERGGRLSPLAGLPGTILRVADLPGADISIGGAGRFRWDGLPVWTFHGSINTQTLTPRDPLRVRGTVRVDSPALQGVNALPVHTTLRLERLSDTDGSSILSHNTFASTFPTPTGLPIERDSLWWDAELQAYQEVPLTKTAATQAEAEIDLTLPLPPDLPAGYYRPFLHFYSPDMPAEDPPSRSVILLLHQAARSFSQQARLPIIRIGHPASAPPRLAALIGYAQQRLTWDPGRGRRRPLRDRATGSDHVGHVCDPAPGCSVGPTANLSPRTVRSDRESRERFEWQLSRPASHPLPVSLGSSHREDSSP